MAIIVAGTAIVRIYLDLLGVPVNGDSGRSTALPVQVGDLNAMVKQIAVLVCWSFNPLN